MPVVLLTWMLVIFGLFFYHDKTITVGAMYESVAVASDWYSAEEEVDTAQVCDYFQSRIKGKLLFFARVSAEVRVEQDQIVIEAYANRRGMKMNVTQKAAILYPEKEIRKIRRIKEGLEELTK